MEFNAHKAIYLQICDQINEKILSGELKSEDRIPSVRELGATLGVNPNTIMRAYDYLQNKGIIYNKRGIGYFISSEAKELVLNDIRTYFIEEELPLIFKKMDLLGIRLEDLNHYYNKKNHNTVTNISCTRQTLKQINDDKETLFPSDRSLNDKLDIIHRLHRRKHQWQWQSHNK
jgi:Predicted transcriptional regulators